MRIVVTGANGQLGRVVIKFLLAQGMDVCGVDREIDRKMRIALTRVDLCNLGQVFGALAGADAVVHLGAIPSPGGYPPEVIYTNNVTGQFNVFEAAAKLGIQRVVSASSFSAYGFPFQHRWSEPLYVPIDEAHPLLAQDAYGLSKANGEEIAAAYTRRTGGCAVSLRISTIVNDESIHRFLAYMRQKPVDWAPMFWSYVHIDDVVTAILHSLTRPLEGHQVFNITANDLLAEQPTDELLDQCFPNVPRHNTSADAYWSLVDCQRAASLLDYHPTYRWADALEVRRPGEERRVYTISETQEDQR